MTQRQKRDNRGRGLYKCPRCDREFDGLDGDDVTTCPECGSRVRVWRSRVYRLGFNDEVRKLANGPATGDDLTRGIGAFPGDVRQAVHTVGTSSSPGTTVGGDGQITTVYYLSGDIRRAVDRFIEENRSLVEATMDSTTPTNLLRSAFDEDVYQMLVEQWEWNHRGDARED